MTKFGLFPCLALPVLVIQISLVYSISVHLSYNSSDLADSDIPEVVNISISSNADVVTKLELLRIPEHSPNVPLYTLRVGADGEYEYRKEKLKDRQDLAYYADASKDAVIQVTKLGNMKGGKPHLLLRGDLVIEGHRYSLDQPKRFRRAASHQESSSTSSTSSSPSSDDVNEIYDVKLERLVLAEPHDFLDAPPELKKIVQEKIQPEEQQPLLSFFNQATLKKIPPSLKMNGKITNRKDSPIPPSTSGKRYRRQANTYYVDVVAVVDYAIYKRFLDDADNREEALEDIREYYAFMFTGVDLRYQSITSMTSNIRVRLTKVVVTETTQASSFTEQYRLADDKWDEVDATLALSAFREFASGKGGEFLFPYDHATVFTGYDLTSTTGTTSTNSTTGLAYTSTLCRTDGYSVSVVEDLGGFQAVDTAAHELGHSLSARHDGDDNPCRSSDRYIMAGGSYPETNATRLNPWLFSSCSINYFNNFIQMQMRSSQGRTCLTQPLSVSASIPNVQDRLPGQEISPDDQCRMIYGSASRLCRGTEFGTVSDICTSMYCYDPSTTGTCYEHTAARGTSCGNGKICLSGDCVSDARGVAMDDFCPFGDQPGIAFGEQECPDFVSSFTGYCYQLVVRGRCCASCKTHYRAVANCEYGDSVRGCDSSVCRFATSRYREQCCESCGVGNPISTTPASTRDPNSCEDSPNVLVNGDSCSTAILANPQYCYQNNVRDACCTSCSAIDTNRAGCEYGDLYPSQCRQVTSCSGLQNECCDTCGAGSPVTSPTTTRRTTLRVTTPPPVVTTTPPGCRDNPNILVNGVACSAAVSRSPLLCYQDNVLTECCQSCSLVHTGVEGCEYGDRYTQCRAVTTCRGIERECCQTCASPTTPTTERPTTRITPRTTARTTRTQTPRSTQTTPTRPQTTASTPQSPVCVDGVFAPNGKTCSRAIQDSRSLCYRAEVRTACCASCRRAHSGVPACPYGDAYPAVCSGLPDCENQSNNCCQTCPAKDPNGARQSTSGVTSYLVTAVAVVFVSLCLL
ncbi:uncharacterized protein LOC101852348 [Aplysia californica]|uniref:Uncharacterized protein LOC101852348 n=1 Tax=Aplysia californica TaxID=6500 RepID=A0ABM1A771_APLCA|nr:uncharacterized protein LOC101852348 [Aplysia californica]